MGGGLLDLGGGEDREDSPRKLREVGPGTPREEDRHAERAADADVAPGFRHFCFLSWKPVLPPAGRARDPVVSALPQPAVWSAGSGGVAWLGTRLPDLLPGRRGTLPKGGAGDPHTWVGEGGLDSGPSSVTREPQLMSPDLRFRVGKMRRLSDTSVLTSDSLQRGVCKWLLRNSSQPLGEPLFSSAAHCLLCA